MLPCNARPSDIRVRWPRRAPRKRQRRTRDEETTRQTCMGTYHWQTFRNDNKWRHTQVKCNRYIHPVHILFCWHWACTNSNTQPQHKIVESRNSHMDTKCDGSLDNCTECCLTTMYCLFVLDVSPIGEEHTNTGLMVDQKNIRCKSKNYMVNSQFAYIYNETSTRL